MYSAHLSQQWCRHALANNVMSHGYKLPQIYVERNNAMKLIAIIIIECRFNIALLVGCIFSLSQFVTSLESVMYEDQIHLRCLLF